MDLNKILKNASVNKTEENFNVLLYIALVEWGWSWEQFKNTPIPIFQRCLNQHKKIKENEEKQLKKK